MRSPEQPAPLPDSKHSMNPNPPRTWTGYLASLRAPGQPLHLMNRTSGFRLSVTTGNRTLVPLDHRINRDSGVTYHTLSGELVSDTNLEPTHWLPVNGRTSA